MHIQFYLDKRHSIYKTNIMQHCTEISNTKDSFKWQPLFTYIYIYIFFVGDKKCMVVFSILIQYFRYFISPSMLSLSPKQSTILRHLWVHHHFEKHQFYFFLYLQKISIFFTYLYSISNSFCKPSTDCEQITMLSVNPLKTEQITMSSVNPLDCEQITMAFVNPLQTEQITMSSVNPLQTVNNSPCHL